MLSPEDLIVSPLFSQSKTPALPTEVKALCVNAWFDNKHNKNFTQLFNKSVLDL